MATINYFGYIDYYDPDVEHLLPGGYGTFGAPGPHRPIYITIPDIAASTKHVRLEWDKTVSGHPSHSTPQLLNELYVFNLDLPIGSTLGDPGYRTVNELEQYNTRSDIDVLRSDLIVFPTVFQVDIVSSIEGRLSDIFSKGVFIILMGEGEAYIYNSPIITEYTSIQQGSTDVTEPPIPLSSPDPTNIIATPNDFHSIGITFEKFANINHWLLKGNETILNSFTPINSVAPNEQSIPDGIVTLEYGLTNRSSTPYNDNNLNINETVYYRVFAYNSSRFWPNNPSAAYSVGNYSASNNAGAKTSGTTLTPAAPAAPVNIYPPIGEDIIGHSPPIYLVFEVPEEANPGSKFHFTLEIDDNINFDNSGGKYKIYDSWSNGPNNAEPNRFYYNDSTNYDGTSYPDGVGWTMISGPVANDPPGNGVIGSVSGGTRQYVRFITEPTHITGTETESKTYYWRVKATNGSDFS